MGPNSDSRTHAPVDVTNSCAPHAEHAPAEVPAHRPDLAQLFDALPHPVFWKDRQGVYLGCNELFARAAGLRCATEIAGKTDADLPWPRAGAQAGCADDRAVIESGQPLRNMVESLQLADGTHRWVCTTRTPLRDADRQVYGVLGVYEDITERQRAEEAARQERHFSESALEAMPGVFFMFDEHGRFVKWNRNLETQSGYAGDEIGQRTVFDLLRPDCWELVRQRVQEVFSTGSAVAEVVFVSKTGRETPYLCHGLRIALDGKPCFLGVGIDLSERKQAEVRVQGLNRMKEELLGDGDLDAKLRRVTDSVVEIFGADFARIWLSRPGDLCTAGCIHATAREEPHVCRQRDRCLHLVASSGRYTHLDGARHRRVPFGCYKIGRIASGDEPSFLTNTVADDPRVHDHEWAKRLGLVSFAGYRLLSASQETVGVLALFSCHRLSPEDDTLLASVAATTSQVILAAQAQAALRESEQRYRNFIANASEGIYRIDFAEPIPIDLPPAEVAKRIDRVAIVGEVNQALARMYGLRAADMVGRPATDFAPHYGQRGALVLHRENYQVVEEETLDVDQDGRPIHLSENYTGVVENGHLVRIWGVQRDITERRRAEEALRAAEERWQFALEGAGDGVWDWNAQTNEVFFSRQWKAMLGYAEDEIGATLAEWESRVHPDDRARVMADLQRHLSGQTATYVNEHRVRCKDGSWKWILDRGKVVSHTPDGRPLRVVGTHTDLTGRKRTEEALQLDESRLEALLQLNQMTEANLQEISEFAMEEAVRLTRSKLGYIAFANEDESVLTMLAWSKGAMEECAVKNRTLIYPVATTGLWGEAVRQRRPIITNDYAAPNLWKHGTPAGHVNVQRHMNVPVFDGDRIVIVAGVGNKATDYDESDVRQLTLLMSGMWRIVQRKRAEEQSRASEARLRSLIRAAPIGILFTKDRTAVSVNDALCELLGYSQDELLGRTTRHSYFTQEEFDDVGRKLYGPVPAGRCAGVETRLRRKDGTTIYVLLTSAPLCPENGAAGFVVTVQNITERKRAEMELLREKQFTEKLLESLPGIFFLYDSTCHLKRWNKAHETAMGFTADELRDWYIPDWHETPEDAAVGMALVKSVLETGVGESFETTLINKQGRFVPYLISITRLMTPDGPVMMGIGIDITERKRAEEALRRTNETLQALVAASPLAIVTYDADHNIATWSPAAEQIFGWGAREVVGRAYPLAPPGRAEEAAATIEQALHGVSISVQDRVRQRKDGSLVDVSISTAPLRDATGRIVGAMAILADVTEHRRADRELKASESTLRSVFRATPIGIIFTMDRVILSANDSMCELTGYDQAELLGHTTRKLYFTPEEFEDVGRRLYLPVSAGGQTSIESRWRRKDGTAIDVLLTGALLRPEAATAGFVVTIQDITQRRRAEEERQKLEAQLRQAQKLEAIGQLAGGVAHDFNNILTAVFGQVDLAVQALETQYPAASNLLDGMHQIERSAQRAAALTRQLLAFSRRQVVRPEVLNLNTTLRDVEKMLRRLLTENIVVELVLDPNLATIEVDAGQLEQVIVNLVVNARDAMPGGGRLTIETSHATLDNSYVALHPEARPGAYVLLTVSDTGCGMEPATLERVFEPFFTTKPTGQGTGLGLSTVYGIVTQAGGHVTAYSELGCGSSFKAYFPVSHGPQSLVEPVSTASAPAGAETLIVCEDDAAVRDLTARILTGAGYVVLLAQDAHHALQLAAEHNGPIQLLVTDVIMPDQNGRELAEALAAERPGIRTLFVSGYPSNVIAHHGVLDEDVDFLEKPYSRPQLLQKIRDILDQAEPPAAGHGSKSTGSKPGVREH